MKKTGKLLLCALLILSLLLTAAACGKEEKQTIAGYYTLTQVEEGGEKLTPEDLSMEKDAVFLLLNEDGTAAWRLFDELIDLTWKDNQIRPVEGEDTDPISFTLKADLLTLELDGTTYTFRRSNDAAPDLDALREELAKPQGPSGCYVLKSMTMEGETIDAELLESFGMSIYIEFYEDGTGTINMMGDEDTFEWEEGTIYSGAETLTYTLDGDTLTITDGEEEMVLVAGEKPETPVAPTEPIEYPDELPEGRYYLVEVTVSGTSVSGDDLIAAGLGDTYIEYYADGTGEMSSMGDVEDFTWEGLTMTDATGETITYTYDGVYISFDQTGVTMTFSKEGATAKSDIEAYWDGGWYGWWIMENCTGSYADMEGYWWDICAKIDVDADGFGLIDLWDEDYTEDEPMGIVGVQIYTDKTDDPRGMLCSISGEFDIAEIAPDDWACTPYDGDYDNCLIFTGTAGDSEDGYEYTIVLRPWGTLWDDMEEDLLPYYYESWYLPLIEANESMPDHITTE